MPVPIAGTKGSRSGIPVGVLVPVVVVMVAWPAFVVVAVVLIMVMVILVLVRPPCLVDTRGLEVSRAAHLLARWPLRVLQVHAPC